MTKKLPAFEDCYEQDPETDCWVWDEQRRNATNYGVYGRHLAHRLSWQRQNGEIPKGLYVLHHCDNPPCVNPQHLYAGTQAQNMRDMASRGRHYVPPLKTHCDNGHEMSGDNLRTYPLPSGPGLRRYCRACMKVHYRNYARRQQAKRDAERPPPPAGRIGRNQAVAEYQVSPSTLQKYVKLGDLSKPVVYRKENYYLREDLDRMFSKRTAVA